MFHTEVQHVSLHAGNFKDLTARGYIWVGLGGGGGGGCALNFGGNYIQNQF